MVNKRNFIGAAVLLAGATVATWAVAGQTYYSAASVDPTNRTASGTFITTRNATSSQSAIQCNLRGYSSGSTYAECWARDADGDYLICGSSNDAFMKVLAGLSSNTYVYFTADASGACTNIVVSTGSRFI